MDKMRKSDHDRSSVREFEEDMFSGEFSGDGYGHGGDVFGRKIRYDLSVNIAGFRASRAVRRAVRKSADHIGTYPDHSCRLLRRTIAGALHVDEADILCGNGAAQLLYLYVHASRPRRALLFVPSFSEYERALRSVGCRVDYVYTKQEEGFVPTLRDLEYIQECHDVVFLCSPGNPSGRWVGADVVSACLRICRKKRVRVVLDLCFADFVDAGKRSGVLREALSDANVLTVTALTKSAAMAGIRLGYAVCNDRRLLTDMARHGEPWRVSVTAQMAGCAAFESRERRQREGELWKKTKREREYLEKHMRRLGLSFVASDANFLLFSGPARLDEALLRRGILIRNCSNYRGLGEGWYRVAIRGRRASRCFLRALRKIV